MGPEDRGSIASNSAAVRAVRKILILSAKAIPPGSGASAIRPCSGSTGALGHAQVSGDVLGPLIELVEVLVVAV